MPAIHFNEINFLAVVVAALAAFMVGGLWYSVLFGKLWITTQGYSEAQVAEMKAKMSPVKFFGGMIVSYLVASLVMAVIFQRFDVDTAFAGAKVGLAIWVIVAAVEMTTHIASNKLFAGYLIDITNQLVYFLMIGAILGGWHHGGPIAG